MLAPTVAEKGYALATLLGRLPGLVNKEMEDSAVADLAPVVPGLACTAEDRENARNVMLGILASPYCSYIRPKLMTALIQLAREPQEKSQLRHGLLEIIRDGAHIPSLATLALAIYQLDPDAQETRSALAAAIAAIAGAEDDRFVCDLADAIILITPATQDRRHAREILMARMTRVTDEWALRRLVDSLKQLDPTPEDMRQARHLLLRLMATETIGNRTWCPLAGSLKKLDPTPEDMRQARHFILQRMATGKDKSDFDDLAKILAQLDPAVQEKRQACRILSDHAAAGFHLKWVIDKAIANLSPTVEDVSPWKNWDDYLPLRVLAAVRRNSPLNSWLALIHEL